MRHWALSAILFLFLPLSSFASDVPDPAKLQPSWWKYFENKEESDQHINAYVEELDHLKKSLDKQKQRPVVNEIDQAIYSLKSLQNELGESFSYDPVHPIYAPTYHLTDWLEVSQRIRLLEEKSQHSQQDIKRLQSKMDLVQQNLDLLWVRYPVELEGTAPKLIAGLKIVSSRISIEIITIKIRRLRKTIKLIDDDLIKLKKEKAFAEENLDLSNLTEGLQKEKVQEAQSIYNQSYENLLQLEGEKLKLSERAATSLAKTHLLDLQIALREIEREQSQIHLIFEKTLLNLVSKYYQNDSDHWHPILKAAHTKIAEWKEVLEDHENLIMKEIDEPSLQNNFSLERVTTLQSAEKQLQQLSSTLSNAELLLSKYEDLALSEQHYIWQKVGSFYLLIKKKLLSIFETTSYPLFRINDYPVTIWVLLRAILVVFLTTFFWKTAFRFFKKNKRIAKTIGRANLFVLGRIGYYIAFALGLLFASISLGFDMTNLVIIGGALSVGIGLGMQSMINNFISGLMVLFEKTLRVGDIIELDSEHRGRVTAINIRNTHIRSFDGKDIIVPNSDLLSKRLINWTMKDSHLRLQVPFSVAYGSSKEKVVDLVLEAANDVSYTLKDEAICPLPQVVVVELGPSGIHFELIVWVDLKNLVSRKILFSHYYTSIETSLTKNGIVIPFPQRTVHMLQRTN